MAAILQTMAADRTESLAAVTLIFDCGLIIPLRQKVAV